MKVSRRSKDRGSKVNQVARIIRVNNAKEKKGTSFRRLEQREHGLIKRK